MSLTAIQSTRLDERLQRELGSAVLAALDDPDVIGGEQFFYRKRGRRSGGGSNSTECLLCPLKGQNPTRWC
jgi:hypothetical protein